MFLLGGVCVPGPMILPGGLCLGTSVQGSLSRGISVGRPPPESEKWTLCMLLECCLVLILCIVSNTITITIYAVKSTLNKGQNNLVPSIVLNYLPVV